MMVPLTSLKLQCSIQSLCVFGVRRLRERFIKNHVSLTSGRLARAPGSMYLKQAELRSASFAARNLPVRPCALRVEGLHVYTRQYSAVKAERVGQGKRRRGSKRTQSVLTESATLVDTIEEQEEESDVEDEEGEESIVPQRRSNVNLPAGTQVKVKTVEFIKSSKEASECPKDSKPEFAIIGRSNVGKSSLINLLVNRREMAMTSKKPGKTQMINHFLINNSWYLVDLPGYGFANAPKAVRADWNDFTKNFFVNRESLVSVLLLVDASIPPLQIDLECADWLGSNKIPVTIVFTKCDRRKKKKKGGKSPHENVADFESRLKEIYSEAPPWIMTSSETRMGRDDLLLHIAQLRTFWAAEG